MKKFEFGIPFMIFGKWWRKETYCLFTDSVFLLPYLANLKITWTSIDWLHLLFVLIFLSLALSYIISMIVIHGAKHFPIWLRPLVIVSYLITYLIDQKNGRFLKWNVFKPIFPEVFAFYFGTAKYMKIIHLNKIIFANLCIKHHLLVCSVSYT